MNDAVWRKQRGAVILLVGVAIVVLVGFLGLVVDLGRMFVIKSEVQNSTDACALAAARELKGVNANQLELAENAGLTVGKRNKVNFQNASPTLAPADVTFSATLNGSYQPRNAISAGDVKNMKYARCEWSKGSIVMHFIRVLGFGEQSVAAFSVATLGPSQANCASIPIGLCSKPPPASCPHGATPGSYGHCPGDWIGGKFSSGNGFTGNYNWLDFAPPNGGASEVKKVLTGSETCNMQVGSPVGQTGAINGVESAWNSRFGLYKNGSGNPQPDGSPPALPDDTGYSYTSQNWPATIVAHPDFHDAYGQFGTTSAYPGAEDFRTKRGKYASYGDAIDTVANGNAITGLSIANSYHPISHGVNGGHDTYGTDRRITTVPIVDCAAYASSQYVPIKAFACVLMLQPVDGPNDNMPLEYIGEAGAPGVPCATTGIPGGTGSSGPKVPVLVK